MSSGSYRQVHVGCPFYKFDDGRSRVNCEGIVENSTLALIFHKRADYEQQMELFCCQYYQKCEVYRMLMENKYED